MFNFKNDYSKIAHKNILEALLKYSDENNIGYGLDKHSLNAKNLIKKHLKKDSDIHFFVGGTIANKTVISHSLKPYEAVISVESGHIYVHETGAIEQTGHKIITVKGENGKITSDEIINVLKTHTDEHMVYPKMVYISQSTEIGTIYTKNELIEISKTCKENNLYLFIDGARLSVALNKSDMTLADLEEYSDAFYIGGTKNGALLGEAVVISNDEIKKNFRFSIKQNGGLYAKGFVTAIQFEELFKENLYFELGKNANDSADYLALELGKRNINLAYPNVTNQLFVEVSNKLYEDLKQIALFELWEDKDNYKVIRLVTDFSMNKEYVDKFLIELDRLL